MKKQNTLLWIVLIGLVIFGLSGGQLSNLFPTGTTTQQPVAPAPSTSTGPQQTINVSTTTFALHPYDAFKPGAVIDIEGVVMKGYDVKFDSDNLVSDTVILRPLETYTIYLWDDGQTTNLAGTTISLDTYNDWYGYQATITMPFSGEATFPGDFQTDYKGNYKIGTPSVYAKNPDGTINSSTSKADLSPGQVKTFILHYDAPNNAAFGAPQAKDFGAYLKLACDFNEDAYDSVEMTSAIYDGRSYEVRETSDYPDFAKYDWVGEIVGLSSIVNNKSLEIGVTVKAASGGTIDANTGPFTCVLLDPQLWYDYTNGTGFHWGVDDSEANTDVGGTNVSKTIYVQ